jgi:hypothetical protein
MRRSRSLQGNVVVAPPRVANANGHRNPPDGERAYRTATSAQALADRELAAGGLRAALLAMDAPDTGPLRTEPTLRAFA